MTGGTDRVRYAPIAGYVGGSGFEDVTYTPQLHRLTLRGNLDFNVTDFRLYPQTLPDVWKCVNGAIGLWSHLLPVYASSE